MNYKAAAQALRDLAEALETDDAPPKKPPVKKAPVEEDDEPAPPKKPPVKKAPVEEDDEPTGLDYATEVKPHVVKLSKDHGREVALEVLEKFTNPATDEPCTKGAEVDPADYEKLMKAIKRKIAELAD